MEELQNLRAALIRRSALETELAEYASQVEPLQQELRRLARIAETMQAEADSLAASSLKGLFLKLTGKQEAAVAQAQQEARTAGSALSAADFRLKTTQAHIAALTDELAQTASCEESFLTRLRTLCPGDPRLAEAQGLLERLHQGDVLTQTLQETGGTLFPLIQDMVHLYNTGDIRTDLVGHRYDNKFPAMRDKAIPCQAALNRFTELLSQYTAFFGLDFQAAAPGPWVTEPSYLTAPAFDAQELFERIDSVRCWLRQLDRCGQDLAPMRKAQEQTSRQEFRRLLLAIHDSMNRKADHVWKP